MRRLLFVVALVLVSVTAARAQDPPRVTFGASGAIVAPLSGTADNFSIGYGLGGTVVFPISHQMGVQLDYLYSRLDGNDKPQVPPGFGSKMSLQYGTAAFVFQAPPGPFRLYLVAGGGLYFRSVTLSTSGTGSASVCNPWWFVCTSQPVPAQSVAGSHSSTDFGLNVGAGLTAGRFIAEARYHYAFGPSYSTPSGPQEATGKFFQLTIGARF